MHFRANAFSKNGLPTIVSKDGNVNLTLTVQRTGLSEIDLKRLNLAYKVS